ncbi:MAG: hypothetical protein HYW23_00655, partial [Candidatus Aenigmarchaeota archaeon]|nr:hypothetical protein [Candidatus Aenigmarchaeota archaeon]
MAVFDGMRNIAQNYREAVSPTPVSLTKETGFKHQRRFPDVLRECGELARKTGAYAVSFYDAGTAEFTFCPYSHNSQYRVALLNDSRDPRESFTGAEIGALNDFVRARGGTVRIYSETFNPNGFGNITFPYVQPGQERTRQERIEHREEVEVKERIFPLLP